MTNIKTHPFTGIFKGATHGVVRLSIGSKPDTTVLNLAPGMSLKFLRDGMDSVNLVSMFSTDGQPSWNFFANDLSNHVPPITGQVGNKLATVTDYI